MVGVDGYREALRRIADAARQLEATVINAARYDDLPLDAAELVAFQSSLGIHHVPLSWPRAPRYRLSDTDPHPNVPGNARFARDLLAELQEEALLEQQRLRQKRKRERMAKAAAEEARRRQAA